MQLTCGGSDVENWYHAYNHIQVQMNNWISYCECLLLWPILTLLCLYFCKENIMLHRTMNFKPMTIILLNNCEYNELYNTIINPYIISIIHSRHCVTIFEHHQFQDDYCKKKTAYKSYIILSMLMIYFLLPT